ncbi:hypothetical protein H0H92_006810 [Tricholoma furcatifolium]|nr:hypothetical protein H0H92_006810 [Tricholoma furcatifolium]
MARQTPAARSSAASSQKAEKARKTCYPPLPSPVNYSAFKDPSRFRQYINAEFPAHILTSASDFNPQVTVDNTSQEPERPRKIHAPKYTPQVHYPDSDRIETLEWVTKHVFPNAKLPTPYNEDLVRQSPLWDSEAETFKAPLTSEHLTEPGLASWLQDISNVVGSVHGVVTSPVTPYLSQPLPRGIERRPQRAVTPGAYDRSFDSYSSDLGPSGATPLKKPDVTLMDTKVKNSLPRGARLRWAHIQAVIEVSLVSSRPKLLQTLLNRASCIFETQPDRCFVCGLGFHKDKGIIKFFFVLADRSGVNFTFSVPIQSSHALNLGHILYALSFGSPDVIGRDTTMTLNPNTYEVSSITVKDASSGDAEDFAVVKEIHRPINLCGRGTRVFIVQRGGAYFILKDSWILASHPVSEIKQLVHIRKRLSEATPSARERFKHICPEFHMGQDVGERTAACRGSILPKPPDRIHRRLVGGPIGDPITSFRSREEFIKVILDVVEFLQFLDEECDSVHGDISINNIVINRVFSSTTSPNDPPAPEDGTKEEIAAYGVPIDYDYSRQKGVVTTHASGTRPYMPLEALWTATADFVHSPKHDLEALLFVIIVVCLFTAGPGGQLRVPSKNEKAIPPCKWFTVQTDTELARDKAIILEGDEEDIVKHLPPYWEPFAPHLRSLIKATYHEYPYHLTGCRATHDAYRTILQKALNELPKEDSIATYASVPLHKVDLDLPS